MTKSAGARKQIPSAKRSKAEHVVVDGSNLATEGRSRPSLAQLNEAVLAFMDEHPKAVVTVIVDATFGHRIDRKEVAAFDKAVEHNELVTPPAGTVGRGDAFVLNIAEKVGASVLSNDSYQEFHGQYPWLFDEGRLIGGKPVPNIGWVFVERVPVRGDKSRRAVRDARSDEDAPTKKRASKVSAAAMKPMPIPKSPPPGATVRAKERPKEQTKEQTKDRSGSTSRSENAILPFLHFVENHAVGSHVEGRVESYSSHGAYIALGDVRGYVPLRLLGSPPPRSARDVMKIGDEMRFEVVEIIAARRSINVRPAPAGKRTAAKKAVAKKTGAKTTGTKKSAPSKTSTAKSGAAKAGVKKVAAKSSGTKSTGTKKVAAKKAAVKKSGTKAAAIKKPVKTASASASKKSAKKVSTTGSRAGSKSRRSV
ncbi:MAG: S1 RNA-binding domain-containing protein [Actinomycetota bacterium]